MSYKRVNWEDFPKRTTPVNAHNLNIMDKGIEKLDESKLGKAEFDDALGKKADKTSVTSLNDRIDTILTSSADNISAQEIIDARSGETSLGAKITKMDTFSGNTSPIYVVSDGIKPTYDIASKTFTFNSVSRLFYDKESFEIPAGTSVINNETYNVVKLVFDTGTQRLRFEKYWSTFKKEDRLVAVIRNNGAKSNYSATFDIEIVGVPTEKDVDITVLFGEENKYPIINTENQTITFPPSVADVIFISSGKSTTNVVPKSTELVIDYSLVSGQTARLILWKKGTSDFETYSLVEGQNKLLNTSKYALFGTVRTVGDHAFSLPCPYIKNGKGYGTPTSMVSGELLVQNPLNASVKAIAHRGYTADVSENTLSAFKKAKRMGFNYVETDVRRTKDGVPVLLHDETIDRTSNGSGKISELNYDEVKDLDFGSWKNSEYAGEKIPTFDEFIFLCKQLNLHPYIEALTGVNDLYEIVKKHGMLRRVTWIGGIDGILNLDPKARIAILRNDLNQSTIDTALSYKTEENEVFINVHNVALEKTKVESANMQGIEVECWIWGGGETQVLNAVNAGVSGITVDNHNVAEIIQNSLY